MPYTQENRFITIESPLGKDELLLAGFRGNEGISSLFHFDLDLLSENHNVAFENIIGKSVTLSMILTDGSQRFFNGIISSFCQERGGSLSGSNEDLAYYTAEMVPWFWLLTRSANSHIFQKLSVPDIVKKIFEKKGFQDYKLSLHDTYDKRDYCVQYRETDFNFISRLLEDEGICYFFNHKKGEHTLVLADTVEEFKPCPMQEDAKYQVTTGGWLDEDVITGFEKRQEITASKYTHTDYNFKTPATDLKVEVASQQAIVPKELEIYDYPGEYDKRALGEKRSNLRIQEEEIKITTVTGSSNCRAFSSGYRFNLDGYFRDDMNQKPFVLAHLDHMASEEESYLTSSSSSEFAYLNNFTCTPFEVPYRPPRITPKPVMQGTQTAIVTGPSGEEIYTDEHGRVKVQFHWDREGKNDDKSSCWIRVSQAWAGGGWGAMQIPRIGQEVIVDFLEGDPDQPIIIGRVYHGTNKPPYDLPGEKTKSTIKSDSTLGGGGSNEMRFEDKKGEEEIYLHGQKDWTIAIENDKNQTVGHDETLSIKNNRTKDVGVDQKETIGSNKTIGVGSNHDETIGADKTLKVGSNHTETIGSNMTQSVGSNKAETITIAKELTIGGVYQVSVGAAMNETIGGAKAEEIGAAKSVSVGGSSAEGIGGSKSVTAGKDIFEKAGNDITSEAGNDISVKSGKTMKINAGDDFTLKGDKKGVIELKDQLQIKCGKATITMKKNGDITINGKKLNIKGSGDIVMKGSKIKEN